MSIFTFIRTAWSAVWAAYKVLKDLDNRGVAMFSDQWADHVRWHLEMWLFNLSKNPNKGWRRLIQSEDQLIRAGQRVLKSSMVDKIQNCKDDLARTMAEIALENKLRDRPTIADAGGPHVP